MTEGALQRLQACTDDQGGKRRNGMRELTLPRKTVLIYKEPKDLKMEKEQVPGASEYTYLTDS